MKKFWADTPSDYKDYLFIYLWGVIWAVLNLVQPRTVDGGDGGVVTVQVLLGIVAVGGVIAIVGLVRKNNLLLERLGVLILMIGPATYGLILLGSLIYASINGATVEDNWRLVTVMVYAVWPYLFLNKRRRQLRNRVRLVSKIPTPNEDTKL